jgi:RNA polymerase sigma-70 factor (ECF subfamily)
MPSATHRLRSRDDTSERIPVPGMEGEFHRKLVEQTDVLLRHATRLTRDSADASDLVQDTLERALRRAQGFRSGSNLRAWLLTILTHLFIDRCRRCDRDSRVETLDEDHLAAPIADEVVPAWADLTQEEVRDALAQLEPAFREPYELHALELMSYQAVARRLGIPVATVGTRLSRARQRLRALLQDKMSVKAQRKGP